MIRASELRIGNRVMDRGGKTLVIDYWEGPNKIAQTMTIGNTTVHPLTEYCDYLQPIALTPEILEACGFERVKDEFQDNWVLGEGHSVQCRNNTWYFSNDSSDAWCHVLRDIEYLHQLQNLFFALTGEELKAELPVNAQL